MLRSSEFSSALSTSTVMHQVRAALQVEAEVHRAASAGSPSRTAAVGCTSVGSEVDRGDKRQPQDQQRPIE